MSALASLAVHVAAVVAFAMWADGVFLSPDARLRAGAPAGAPDWDFGAGDVVDGGMTTLQVGEVSQSREAPKYEATQETLHDVGLLQEPEAPPRRLEDAQRLESPEPPLVPIEPPSKMTEDAWMAVSEPLTRFAQELSTRATRVHDTWDRAVRRALGTGPSSGSTNVSPRHATLRHSAVVEVDSSSSHSNESDAGPGNSSGTGGSAGSDGVSQGPVELAGNLAPHYPPECLRRRQQGAVSIMLDVGPDGRVTACTVERSSGIAALDEAALIAVKTWRFTPEVRGGKPVACRVVRRIEYHISTGAAPNN